MIELFKEGDLASGSRIDYPSELISFGVHGSAPAADNDYFVYKSFQGLDALSTFRLVQGSLPRSILITAAFGWSSNSNR